ncbi:histidinol-phosphatase HisJ [Pseudalkalibacillus hwajinpoensis]|uniref:histidinol-phosphatase HisJ n=1 Tax=Guptibacillus hwajinpoensis TaxID=208199 RepID=UPI0019276C62|nr:histidinol-phosphatase HisJ [Pseudalkalibacillus hwajinpoensis]
MNISYDGHIHSPFCPHGSTDQFEEYVEAAIQAGYKGMTFTEHAPLPKTFTDPVPDKDSGMKWGDVHSYFNSIQQLKEKYKGLIEINSGLEVDYIEGYEEETRQLLDSVGPLLDDAILSVHFIKHGDFYTCLDYSPEAFNDLIQALGSVEMVHKKYYETVLKSIKSNLGNYKPTRIGHMTLANKFQKKYPVKNDFQSEIATILIAIKDHNYSLDYNGAGTVKPLCEETYPSDEVVKEALKREIPLVYGSDAHSAKGIGQGADRLITHLLQKPNIINHS